MNKTLSILAGMTIILALIMIGCSDDNDSNNGGNIVDFGKRDASKEFEITGSPGGIWTDGTTIWVGEYTDNGGKVIAYSIADGSRNTNKDFDLIMGHEPSRITSDGTTIWVASYNSIAAYVLSTGDRDQDKEFALASSNKNVAGIWTDGTTMWVTDNGDSEDKLYAYTLIDGNRNTNQEFEIESAGGLWSNGNTMWIAESRGPGTQGGILAYTMSEGKLDHGKSFDTHSDNMDPYIITSDGTTMWVLDDNAKLYAYTIGND